MFSRLFQRKASEKVYTRTPKNDYTRLVEFLIGRVVVPSRAGSLIKRGQNFLALEPREQELEISDLYMVFEVYLTTVDNHKVLSVHEFRGAIKKNFPQLIRDPVMGLVLADSDKQAHQLARLLLENAITRLQQVIGEEKARRWKAYLGWIEWPKEPRSELVPPDLKTPITSTDRLDLFVDFSRRFNYNFTQSLGQAAVDRLLEQSFDALHAQYGRLDTFPMLIQLMPKAEIDEDKVDILSRHQVQQTFKRQLTQLEKARTHAQNMALKYEAVLETVGDGILTFDDQGVIKSANYMVRSTWHMEESDILGMSIGFLFSQWPLAGSKHLGEKLTTESPIWLNRIHEFVAIDANKNLFPVEVVIKFTETTEDCFFTCSLRDISARKDAEESLIQAAYFDPLTTLPNRTKFLADLQIVLEQGLEDQELFAVVFIDLDRFKSVNDSLGHAIGDKLLMAVACRLLAIVRTGDEVARLGGDEFTLILRKIKNSEQALKEARRLQQELAQPFIVDGRTLYSGGSVGIALSNESYQCAEDILRDADTAMYESKHDSSNSPHVFNEKMHLKAVARMNLDNDLRQALVKNELSVNYQPIVDLQTQALYGLEALVRWEHPERGLVLPDEFISFAEETGQIAAVENFVISAVAADINTWRQRQSLVPSVSVNISGSHLANADFLSDIETRLAEFDLPFSVLRLELTESVLMDYSDVIMNKLLPLHNAGMESCIDDFGTGYSSLSYLHHLPCNVVKIDRSFVQAITTPDASPDILKAIVNMCQSLGKRVVAEGIESKEQMDRLSAMGCHYGQGSYFDTAMNDIDVMQYLDTQNMAFVATRDS